VAARGRVTPVAGQERAERLIRQGGAPTRASIDEVARSDAAVLGERGVRRREAELRSALVGLGPLEEVVADDAVTDVLVNGDGAVWVDRGRGVERSSVDVGDPVEVRRLAMRLAGLAGRRLDDAAPFVDGLLPDGSRLHALLPPLVEGGAHISIRVPRQRHRGLDDLVALGMLTRSEAVRLREAVAHRRSIIVSGGTGSGKTTLLAALLACVPARERILLVEDVTEMSVAHPHTVRLQGRAANAEGAGRVTLEELVRQALRMRPDRLVVGEVRGAEVRELLMALNTGHEGGCGTVHANRAADVPARLEALGGLGGADPQVVRAQALLGIDLVVHLRRGASGRRVEEIVPFRELVGS
jgi:pilus assembly protein CpaF